MKKLIAFLLALCLLASCAMAETVRYVNNKNGLVIRTAPDFNAEIAGYIPYKENVQVLEEADKGFFKISYGEITGYAWGYYLTEEDISEKGDVEMYVTAWAGLNLHAEDNIMSDVLTGVPFGTKVIVKEISEKFCRVYVTVDGVEYKGYLWTSYLSKDTPDAAHAKEHHDAIVASYDDWSDDTGSGTDTGNTPADDDWGGDTDWSW